MGLKKAQVTIYIIIGIVILFSVVILLFLRAKESKLEAPKITEEIPTEMQPIKAFVQNCIDTLALDAVKRIGTHGGYIGLEPTDTLYTTVSFKTDYTGTDPTSNDALTVSEDWKIPYWFHMKSGNKCKENCMFEIQRPPLYRKDGDSSIERQIDRYLEMNIPICTRNFESFKEKGMDIKNTSGIKAITTIAKEDISVYVDYPLEIVWAGGRATVSQFGGKVDNIEFARIYNLATEIINVYQRSRFLEKQALNVIAVYSGIDEKKLPPMAGTDFSFTSKTWQRSEVRAQLEQLLSIYINMLQTTYTRGFELVYDEDNNIKTGLYSQMIIDLSPDYAYVGDIDVSFNYLGWPIYFYITKGETIKAKMALDIPIVSMLIPMQRYDLPYDVSFPVMVSLHDPTAFKGKGYDFFFAIEANIRNNEPMTAETVQLTMPTLAGSTSNQICADEQRNSGNVTFKATDALGNPALGVAVVYSVGDSGCAMGETELDKYGNAVFNGKFPKGAFGTIILMHTDYGKYAIEYFKATDDKQDLGTIKLNRFIEKDVGVVKMNINKGADDWAFDPAKLPFGAKQHAIVMLQKIKESPYDDDVIAAADLRGTALGKMRIIPGDYNLKVLIIHDDVILIIPEDEVCTSTGIGTTECNKIDKVVLANNGPFMGGQYDLNVTFGNSIYHNNIIEFHALNFNLLDVAEEDRKHDDLKVWGNVDNIAKNNYEDVQPELVSSIST